jgi:hypothetical protein
MNKPVKTYTGGKPNYVAEAPYQPGYEDAVVTEPKPFLYGIYKSKPLSDKEIVEIATEHINMTLGGERFGYLEFARAIEKAHGIK